MSHCCRQPWYAARNTLPPHCRYWIGYTTLNGAVSDVTGANLGAINSSRSPYLHFVAYEISTAKCVAAGPSTAYQIFEWWWVAWHL